MHVAARDTTKTSTTRCDALSYVNGVLHCTVTSVDQFGDLFQTGGATLVVTTSPPLKEPATWTDLEDGTYDVKVLHPPFHSLGCCYIVFVLPSHS